MPVTATIPPPQGKTLPDLTVVSNSNGPDRDEFLFMVGQLGKADLELKEKKDARKKLRQHFMNRGVNLAAMDWAIAESEKEDNTTLDNMRDQKRYAEFLGLPIAFQLDFFDQPAASGTGAAVSLMEKAFREGREAGIKGKNCDDQKYPPMTPEGQEHLRGWTEGQQVNLAKFKDLETGLTQAEADAAKAKAAKEAKKAAKAEKKAGAAPLAEPGESIN